MGQKEEKSKLETDGVKEVVKEAEKEVEKDAQGPLKVNHPSLLLHFTTLHAFYLCLLLCSSSDNLDPKAFNQSCASESKYSTILMQ